MRLPQRSESFALNESFNFQKPKDGNQMKIERNYNSFQGKESLGFFSGAHVFGTPGGKTKIAHVLFIDIARLYCS